VEIVEINAVWNDGDWDATADVFPNKSFVVRSANDLQSAATSGSFLERPQFGEILVVQNARFQRGFHALLFHQLVLEIDTGPIQHKRDAGVCANEELAKDQIQNVRSIILAAGDELPDFRSHSWNGPMGNSRWQRIQQALRKKALPGRVLERNNADPFAKIELRGVSFAFSVFGEGEQVDLMISSETLQQMIGAVVGAAVQWPRNVWVNSEDSHQL